MRIFSRPLSELLSLSLRAQHLSLHIDAQLCKHRNAETYERQAENPNNAVNRPCREYVLPTALNQTTPRNDGRPIKLGGMEVCHMLRTTLQACGQLLRALVLFLVLASVHEPIREEQVSLVSCRIRAFPHGACVSFVFFSVKASQTPLC